MRINEDRLISLLQAKQREDAERFSSYLPGVAELLPESFPERRKGRSPFGLTPREREYHKNGLSEALGKLERKGMTQEEAGAGLRHCATLIRDHHLPVEADYDALTSLVKVATGKSPGSYKSHATIPLENGGPVLERIPAIRGVYLDLDREQRLVSVSIHPGKFKERRKLMAIVGIGNDPRPDVASRHDHYLATQEPHGDV